MDAGGVGATARLALAFQSFSRRRFLPQRPRSKPPESPPSPIQPRSRGPTSFAGTAQTGRCNKPVRPPPSASARTLTASALKQHLPAGAKLWVNLPPSRELAAKLALGDRNSAVQTAADLAGAHYALQEYSPRMDLPMPGFTRANLRLARLRLALGDHSPGCSPTSQYPVRSDWVAIGSAGVLEEGGAALNNFASLLAKVHGWLELADSPAGASAASYYSLALVPASGETPLAADEPVRQGDLLKMALQSSERVVEKRWVYILDIDCHGKGTVLYPLRLR